MSSLGLFAVADMQYLLHTVHPCLHGIAARCGVSTSCTSMHRYHRNWQKFKFILFIQYYNNNNLNCYNITILLCTLNRQSTVAELHVDCYSIQTNIIILRAGHTGVSG